MARKKEVEEVVDATLSTPEETVIETPTETIVETVEDVVEEKSEPQVITLGQRNKCRQ